MTGFTDGDLDEFRKEVGSEFYVPLNYQLFGRIANMPMWERVLFVWKHKKQHGCGKSDEALARRTDISCQAGDCQQIVVGSERTAQEPKEETERREG